MALQCFQTAAAVQEAQVSDGKVQKCLEGFNSATEDVWCPGLI